MFDFAIRTAGKRTALIVTGWLAFGLGLCIALPSLAQTESTQKEVTQRKSPQTESSVPERSSAPVESGAGEPEDPLREDSRQHENTREQTTEPQQEQGQQQEPEELLTQIGTVRDPRINESSGIARCDSISGTFWTHNDSGGGASLFLISRFGRTLAEVNVQGATNVDWESMTTANLGGTRWLVIGDVGDNLARRNSCRLYFVRPPEFSEQVKAAAERDEDFEPETLNAECRVLTFTYQGGPCNCEAIAFDETANRILLVEKLYVEVRREQPPVVYSIDLQPLVDEIAGAADELAEPAEARQPAAAIARPIATFPIRNVTGMSISPDGSRLLIRNYLTAHLFQRDDNSDWQQVMESARPELIYFPVQRQGEAVCFTADSSSVVISSEVERQPLWKINLDGQLQRNSSADR